MYREISKIHLETPSISEPRDNICAHRWTDDVNQRGWYLYGIYVYIQNNIWRMVDEGLQDRLNEANTYMLVPVTYQSIQR